VMGDLDGRVIAIAGVGGGLGPAVAKRFAEGGATLALTDRDADRLAEVAEDLGLPRERLDVRVVDLLDEDAAREWCASLVERFDRVDGLMHLVGGWRGGDPLASFDLADYEWLHDLLVRTVMYVTRAFHDALTESGRGRFALVSSAQAQAPEGTNAAYAAAKGAAESWTLALADSLSGTGATANIVVVNALLTPAMREAHPRREYPGFTPVEAIAEALAFLCSDSGARMNGQRLSLHP
jgi:NAD(P)-dependent dehydrogenase (short-subunit alcohol dehydrogenase family)